MATNRSYTVIGAFLLGAIALVTVGILTFGNTALWSNKRQAIIFFDQSVLGLSDGSRVLFRGVQIGTVRDVQLRLNPKGGARIAVTIEMSGHDVVMKNGEHLPSDLTTQQLVKRGLRAQLVVYSYVTSQLAVNLSFEPNNKPNFVMPQGQLDVPEIPAVPSEISQLKDTVAKVPWQKILDRANRATQTMVQLAQDLDRTVTTLEPSLRQTSRTTRATLATVRKAVQQNNQQLQATLASLRKLSNNANSQLDKHDQQIDALLTSAQTTSANLAELSGQLNHLTDPASDSGQDLQSTLRDLSASAASLRRFTEKIERNPHTLLYGH